LREIDGRLRIRLEGAIVVGNDQRMRAQCGGVRLARVLEKVEQPFFVQQGDR
jgi:hypothetical protein